MLVRTANAEWYGNLKDGKGNITTETGTLKNVAYNFVSRFEQGNQTNPEELLGAAHAACFSMALANSLSMEGYKVNSIKTKDRVIFEKATDGFKITKIEITTEGEVNEIDEQKFVQFAEKTKTTCPVSRVLTGIEFILNAKLK